MRMLDLFNLWDINKRQVGQDRDLLGEKFSETWI